MVADKNTHSSLAARLTFLDTGPHYYTRTEYCSNSVECPNLIDCVGFFYELAKPNSQVRAFF